MDQMTAGEIQTLLCYGAPEREQAVELLCSAMGEEQAERFRAQYDSADESQLSRLAESAADMLAGRPTFKVTVGARWEVDAIKKKVASRNKRSKSAGGMATQVVVNEKREDLDGGGVRIRYEVNIFGPMWPQNKPGYKLLAIVSSIHKHGDLGKDKGRKILFPNGEKNPKAHRFLKDGTAVRCTHCGSRRKRNHILIVEHEESGKLLALGTECAHKYVDFDSVGKLIRFIENPVIRNGGGGGLPVPADKFNYSPDSVIGQVYAICDEQEEYLSYSSRKSDWKKKYTGEHVSYAMWGCNGFPYSARNYIRTYADRKNFRSRIEYSIEEWRKGERSPLWSELHALATERSKDSTFWANVASALEGDCVTDRSYRTLVDAAGRLWVEDSKADGEDDGEDDKKDDDKGGRDIHLGQVGDKLENLGVFVVRYHNYNEEQMFHFWIMERESDGATVKVTRNKDFGAGSQRKGARIRLDKAKVKRLDSCDKYGKATAVSYTKGEVA